MTFYIDSDYKCRTSPGEGLTAVGTNETGKALFERYGVVTA